MQKLMLQNQQYRMFQTAGLVPSLQKKQNLPFVMPKRDFGKIVEVHLPDLGEGTKEATIKEWYVEPGSKV